MGQSFSPRYLIARRKLHLIKCDNQNTVLIPMTTADRMLEVLIIRWILSLLIYASVQWWIVLSLNLCNFQFFLSRIFPSNMFWPCHSNILFKLWSKCNSQGFFDKVKPLLLALSIFPKVKVKDNAEHRCQASVYDQVLVRLSDEIYNCQAKRQDSSGVLETMNSWVSKWVTKGSARDRDGSTSKKVNVGKRPTMSRLVSIAVPVFAVILVEFDKYRIWEEQAFLLDWQCRRCWCRSCCWKPGTSFSNGGWIDHISHSSHPPF